MRVFILSFLFSALMLAAPETAAQPALAGCQQYGAADFEIGIWLNGLPSRVVSVYEITSAGAVLVDSSTVRPDVYVGGLGCNWIALVGEPGPRRLERDRLYRLDLGLASLTSIL